MSAAAARCDLGEIEALMAAGDSDALARMAECFGERLLSVGLRACRRPDDAEDAVQDALLAAGTRLDTFRGEGSVEAWLSVMVARACYRMQRGQKNDPALHAPAAEVSLPDRARPDPEAGAAARELGDALRGALGALNSQDQRIVRQALLGGRTGPEIARQEGLSPEAVRARLARARRRLRHTLSPVVD